MKKEPQIRTRFTEREWKAVATICGAAADADLRDVLEKQLFELKLLHIAPPIVNGIVNFRLEIYDTAIELMSMLEEDQSLRETPLDSANVAIEALGKLERDYESEFRTVIEPLDEANGARPVTRARNSYWVALAEVWADRLGRKVALSEGGPFFRFVEAASAPAAGLLIPNETTVPAYFKKIFSSIRALDDTS